MIDHRDFTAEFIFTTARSGGAGGQNVNKVESKVTLKFNVNASEQLTEEEKNLIQQRLRHKITQDGFLQIISQTDRSQLRNKELAVKQFYRLITEALLPEKERKATRPTHASVKKRMVGKKRQSDKKAMRARGFEE